MIVVFNNTEYTGDVALTVDWKALRLDPSRVAVANEAFGKPVRLDKRRIVVPIGRRDVRLVGIKPAK